MIQWLRQFCWPWFGGNDAFQNHHNGAVGLECVRRGIQVLTRLLDAGPEAAIEEGPWPLLFLTHDAAIDGVVGPLIGRNSHDLQDIDGRRVPECAADPGEPLRPSVTNPLIAVLSDPLEGFAIFAKR